jgi:hypothetical protein
MKRIKSIENVEKEKEWESIHRESVSEWKEMYTSTSIIFSTVL